VGFLLCRKILVLSLRRLLRVDLDVLLDGVFGGISRMVIYHA